MISAGFGIRYPRGDSNPYGLLGQLILSQPRLPFRHSGGHLADQPDVVVSSNIRRLKIDHFDEDSQPS